MELPDSNLGGQITLIFALVRKKAKIFFFVGVIF
jgi:hypothetical protein